MQQPYQLGYLAACAGQPRQAPGSLDEVEARAWLIGYDDAWGDTEAERAQVLAGFGLVSEPAAGAGVH